MLSVRNRLSSLVLALLLPFVACAEERQNVLLIIVDDLRVELSAYGKPNIKSPNIDALAGQGVLFENAYVNVPVCGASRASLMTGVRPTRDRFVGYQARMDEDAPDAVPLHTLLKQNGYYAESLGKVIHFGDDSADGWSEPPWHPRYDTSREAGGTGHRDYQLPENIRNFLDNGIGPAFEAADVPDNAYYDGKIADRAVASLKRLGDSEQPFFLAVGFLKPHLPFNAPKKYWDLYSEADIELAGVSSMPESAPQQAWHESGEMRKYTDIPPAPANIPDDVARKLIHGYRASVSYTDAQVGRVMLALQESGRADDTIVVFLGDHGWSLGEHGLWAKHSPFDVATHTPLIVTVPGNDVTGRAEGLVEFVDIYPSLLELLGLPGLPQLQGKSFVAQLKDPDAPGKQAVFPRWQSGDVIKTADFALTEWFDDTGSVTAKMLFNHRVDRAETANVAEHDAYDSVVEDMHQRLHELMISR
jgi:arylsulfatase A-like enzyme